MGMPYAIMIPTAKGINVNFVEPNDEATLCAPLSVALKTKPMPAEPG